MLLLQSCRYIDSPGLKEVWPTLGNILTAEQLEPRLENYVTYGIEEVLDLQAYLADFGYNLIWCVVPARDEEFDKLLDQGEQT
jgi:hypothetical protein